MKPSINTFLAILCCLPLVGGVGLRDACGSEPKESNKKSLRQKETVDRYEVRIERDLTYLGSDRSEKFDLYMPSDAAEADRFPGIVIIHGGGWVGGDKSNGREKNIGTTLAQHGYVCMSINYVLAKADRPTWPQHIYDCKTAVQFLRAHADRYQVDRDHIGVIGGSAGGHLAGMGGLTGPESGLEAAGPYRNVSGRVQAAVPMYGIYNLRTWWDRAGVVKYLGAAEQEDPERWDAASPVYQASVDDPPMLLLHGSADKIIPDSQSIELYKTLEKIGVESRLVIVEGAPHSFHLQPEQRDLRPLVIGFFDKHLKKQVEAQKR